MSKSRNILVSLLIASAVVGCETAQTSTLGTPVLQADVSVTVVGTELKYLDLESPSGAVQTREPILLVRVQVENRSAADVRYDLGWSSSSGNQSNTTLLFVDPGAEIAPTQGVNIPAALLSQYQYLGDPVTEPKTIAPGGMLEDVLLFSKPPAGQSNLVLSLPPGIFGNTAKFPAYVRFSAPADVEKPAPKPLGEAVQADGFTFTVSKASVEYVRLNDPNRGEGFSAAPLLKISFTATNTSDAPIEFTPTAASRAVDPPTLIDNNGQTIRRAEFSGGIAPVGLNSAKQQIAPGGKLETELLFERPAESSTSLELQMPGKRFGRSGLVRVAIPYTYSDPPKPEELTPRQIVAPTAAAPTPP